MKTYNQKRLDRLNEKIDTYKTCIDYESRINPTSSCEAVQKYNSLVAQAVALARVMENGRGFN